MRLADRELFLLVIILLGIPFMSLLFVCVRTVLLFLSFQNNLLET